MTDHSYHEKITVKVELNIRGFQEKLAAGDAELEAFAMKKGVKKKKGEGGFALAGDQLIVAGVTAMEKFMREVMIQSEGEVPVDTETLKGSRALFDPYREGSRIIVEAGYGFSDEPNPKTGRLADQYALPVHEIYDAEHPTGKSHYLIDPLMEHAQKFPTELYYAMKSTDTYGRAGGGRLDVSAAEGYLDPRTSGVYGTAIRGGNPKNRGQFSSFKKPT